MPAISTLESWGTAFQRKSQVPVQPGSLHKLLSQKGWWLNLKTQNSTSSTAKPIHKGPVYFPSLRELYQGANPSLPSLYQSQILHSMAVWPRLLFWNIHTPLFITGLLCSCIFLTCLFLLKTGSPLFQKLCFMVSISLETGDTLGMDDHIGYWTNLSVPSVCARQAEAFSLHT